MPWWGGWQILPVQALWRGKSLILLYKSPGYWFYWGCKTLQNCSFRGALHPYPLQLCACSVHLFLCHFARSPALLLFIYTAFFIHKGSMSLLKKKFSLGEQGIVKTFSWALPPDSQFSFLQPKDHGPRWFPIRNAYGLPALVLGTR